METRAEKQVIKEEIRIYSGFKKHLTIFAIGIACLWIAWLALGNISSPPWPLYPSVSWAVVLGIHCFLAFRSIQKRNHPHDNI